jgi:hypothetical protein
MLDEYEIRILNDDGTVAFVVSEFQLSAMAAVRSARAVAWGKRCEVWKGPDRLYPAEP